MGRIGVVRNAFMGVTQPGIEKAVLLTEIKAAPLTFFGVASYEGRVG